jgi:spermidine synthase
MQKGAILTATATVPAFTSAQRALFVVTICAGSFLLFLVQPLIARMALPRLGGAPAVWNSAMLVYQALLLGGYAYAHWLSKLNGRTQSVVHLGGFAIAALMLPIGLSQAMPPVDASPVLWVPWLLLTSIGPIFFIVSAQAPLMQRWFTLSGGDDPYPLYAASNLGSFGGLITYPLIVEPLLPVAQQSLLWSVGYGVLALLVLLCAFTIPNVARAADAPSVRTPLPTKSETIRWITLAAIPSGLMLATTLHLTTDIVAMPLLWVIPLGLYLLSFSVAFATDRRLADFFTRIAPLTLPIAACGVFADATQWQMVFAIATVFNMFVIAVALHSAMFARRPAPEHLTRFYLAMSIGGVIGGIICALIAPLVFDWTYEYPLLMLASAIALAPRALFEKTAALWRTASAARIARFAAIAMLFVSLVGQGSFGIPDSTTIQAGVAIVLIGAILVSMGNRLLYVAGITALMLTQGGWTKLGLSFADGMMTRSYFGVYAVRPSGKGARLLVHGTTVHGIQNLGSEARERMPNSYYAPLSGIGLAMTNAERLYGPNARIAAVGLGAGTLACYAKPGQNWTFYEIDPVIEGIARDPKRFTFLSRCLPDVPVRIGDARLTLAQDAPASADVLAIDAFSSDSVPMHLLTREAFATYARKITPDGLLLVHISNRYLDLAPVIAAAAKDGWVAKLRIYRPDQTDTDTNRYSASNWVALARKPERLEALVAASEKDAWQDLPAREGFESWSDNYASILPILKWKRD